MKETTLLPKDKDQLRHIAEKRMSEKKSGTGHPDTESDLKMLLHELQVHQIELEMQNEELRRTQLELEDSRAQYFDLFDLAPVGYLTLSGKGIILESNLTASALLGITRSVLTKQPFSKFISREDRDIYYLHFNTLIKTGQPLRCELRMLRPGSEPFWARLEATAIQEEKGTPVVRVVINDITERRQAEDEIKRLKSFHETITESIINGIWVSDKNDTIVYMNRGMGVIAGIPPQSAIGVHLWQSFSEETVGEFRKHYTKAKESLESTPYEAITVMTSAGKFTYQSGWLIPLVENDQFNGMICTVEDITERKISEEALRQSEEKYRNIFENIVEGIYRTTPAGRFVVINPAFARICGYESPEEMMEQVSDIANQLYADPEDRLRFQKLIAAEGEVKGFEVRFKNPTKGLVWVSIYSKAICDQQGKIQFYDGTIEDITERKSHEMQTFLQAEVLKILASSITTTQTADKVVEVIKHLTGYDVVGLRLQTGTDYPFVASLGYSEDFLKAENTLRNRYPDGGVCMNADGTISLVCTCGMVISGKTDPGNPLFTAGGSAWTNNSLPILDIPLDADPRLHPRNRCIHEGFLSIALIPVRAGAKVIGLLHLADRKQNQFTPEAILFWEGIGTNIGEALARNETEHDLRERMKELQAFFHLSEMVVRPGITMDELHRELVNILPQSWKYPEIACARLVIGGSEFHTENFVKSPWMQSAPIMANRKTVGRIEVGYREEMPEMDEGPFLKEERQLINAIAERIGHITERKQAVEALSASENKYRIVADNTYDWEFWLDQAGRFVYVSPSCKEIAGHEAEEFVADPDLIRRIVHPDDQEVFNSHMSIEEERRSTASEGELQFRIVRPDGSTRWVGHVCQGIFNNEGQFLGIRGSNRDITDRKYTEEQWKKSEFIINSANELMTLINRDYVYEAVNDSYCRTLGKKKAEVVGRTVSDIWGEKRFNEEIKSKIDICFSGNHVTDEAWIEHPGLGRRYYMIDYYPYKTSGSFCTHAVVVSHDITDRKIAEDELKEAEHKYHSIVENAHEGIFQTTRQGRFLMVNKSLSEMLGYDSADDLMSSVTDISHQLYVTPGARSAILHLIDKMDAVRGFQTQFYRKDGRKIWVSINMHAVRSESGEILYYEGMNEDISERRKAEIALMRSSERLLMAQGAAKAGMWDWDIVTGHIDWSDSLYELFGLSPSNSKASFEAWKNVIHPDDREIAGKRIDETLQQKKDLNSDYRVVLPEGRIRWINAVGKGEYDEQGQPLRMIGICLDITERKESEEALRRQHIQMQQLSSRLVEAEEAERKRITRELHDQVGQNLTALGINLNILRTITAGEASDKIRRSLDESLFLVKQTTEFTRNLMAELRPPVMDDYGLMASIKWYGERFAARTGIAFNMKSVDLIPRPKGLIEVTLFRIIQEALTNAGKHAGASSIDVEGKIINNELRITVVDNGRGFDKQLLARANGRFSWGIMTMIERAQSMGGRLTVESQPGRGTKVVVEVPV